MFARVGAASAWRCGPPAALAVQQLLSISPPPSSRSDRRWRKYGVEMNPGRASTGFSKPTGADAGGQMRSCRNTRSGRRRIHGDLQRECSICREPRRRLAFETAGNTRPVPEPGGGLGRGRVRAFPDSPSPLPPDGEKLTEIDRLNGRLGKMKLGRRRSLPRRHQLRQRPSLLPGLCFRGRRGADAMLSARPRARRRRSGAAVEKSVTERRLEGLGEKSRRVFTLLGYYLRGRLPATPRRVLLVWWS